MSDQNTNDEIVNQLKQISEKLDTLNDKIDSNRKSENNDFVNLVEKNKGVIDKKDLRSLLNVRLAVPSQTSIAGMTASLSVIIGFISANIALIAIYYGIPSIVENQFLQLMMLLIIIPVGIVSTIEIILISRTIINKKKNVSNEEIVIMNQYLEAKKLIKDEK